MKENKFNFQSEKLSVDYMTFTIKNGRNKMEELSQFFNSSYQFNCYLYDHKTEKSEPLLVNGQAYNLTFSINHSPANKNTILIQFSGIHSQYFFNMLKTGLFPWEILNFSDFRLGRIDINYILNDFKFENSDLIDFYQKSIEKYKKRYPAAKTEILQNSVSFGTRKGDYFLRIYQPKDNQNSLKFELEIKKSSAALLTTYLVNNFFAELEDSICHKFYQYLKNALILDTKYTDWFVGQFRKTEKSRHHLVSTYVQQKSLNPSMEEKYSFYRIFQILSFCRKSPLQKEILNGVLYYSCVFPLIDFAEEIGIPKDKFNSYQRQKLVEMFQNLQKLPPLERWFSDQQFVSSVAFPVLKVENQTSQKTKLIVRLSISEELYKFNYPFDFPKNFYIIENNNDLRVKFEIISIFCQPNIRKEFPIEEFLFQFNNFNNQTKRKIKQNIIQQFEVFQNSGRIEKRFLFYQKDNLMVETDRIPIDLINSTKLFIFYENLSKIINS